jgi:hypothetical protein
LQFVNVFNSFLSDGFHFLVAKATSILAFAKQQGIKSKSIANLVLETMSEVECKRFLTMIAKAMAPQSCISL